MRVTSSDISVSKGTLVAKLDAMQNAPVNATFGPIQCPASKATQADTNRQLFNKVSKVSDFRFRALLDPADWYSLPMAVRHRFSKRYEDARTITYTGKITVCRMSFFGKLLAQLLRPVGAPLPISCDVDVPAVVAVTEDEKASGQIWTRIYGRHDKFPQVVQSSKRFFGKTGIEEYVGYGIGMALSIGVTDGALDFRSDHYFVSVGRFRWRLPSWITPGGLLVRHRDIGNGQFDFVLRLEHPLLGELMYQKATFSDGDGRT